jgi:hypothetical protein
MNIFHLNGDIFDLDQVVATKIEPDCLRLTFRNGDQIPVRWRDDRERLQVIETLQRALEK